MKFRQSAISLCETLPGGLALGGLMPAAWAVTVLPLDPASGLAGLWLAIGVWTLARLGTHVWRVRGTAWRAQRPGVAGERTHWTVGLSALLIVLPIVWFVKTNGALNDYWQSQGVTA